MKQREGIKYLNEKKWFNRCVGDFSVFYRIKCSKLCALCIESKQNCIEQLQ